MPASSAPIRRFLDRARSRSPGAAAALFPAATALGVAAGLYLRWQMASMGRSLWLDPAMLVWNVATRGYLELWQPLGENQAAPYGFLVLLKAAGQLGGYREGWLLAVPFLAAAAALGLFAWLAVLVLGREGAPFAVWPLGLSSTPIYYAGEVKQYSAELCAAVLLLLLAWRCARAGLARRQLFQFAAGALVAGWLSYSSFLVAGALLAVLFFAARKSADAAARRRWAVIAATLAGHHGLLYFLQMRPAASRDLFAYHSSAFAPWPPWHDWTWYRDAVTGYLAFPLGSPEALLLPLLGLGLGILALRGRPLEAGLVLAPLAALLAASALKLYPLATGEHDVHSRLVLFSLPCICLLIGRGFASLVPPGRIGMALLLLAALVYPAGVRSFGDPGYLRQEMRPLVADLAAQLEPGDQVYVFHAAEPAFRYYTRGRPIAHRAGLPGAAGEEDLRRDAAALGAGRVWVVLAHFYSGEDLILRGILEERGERLQKHTFPGAVLELYLLRPPGPSQPE